MNDVDLALKQAYRDLLSGITYHGRPVEIYTSSTQAIKKPCIIIGSWCGRVGKPHDTFGQHGEISLEIVAWLPDKTLSKGVAHVITKQVIMSIKPYSMAEVLESPQLRIRNTILHPIKDINNEHGSTSEYRKLITLSHSVWMAH